MEKKLPLEERISKTKRMMIALAVSLVISSGALKAQQQNCDGARLMQILNASSALTICGIFGPYACAGYGAIVIAYDLVIWASSGC